jgi:hypothetical protein
MGYPASQLPHSFHLLGLAQARFGEPLLGHIAH